MSTYPSSVRSILTSAQKDIFQACSIEQLNKCRKQRNILRNINDIWFASVTFELQISMSVATSRYDRRLVLVWTAKMLKECRPHSGQGWRLVFRSEVENLANLR